MPVSPVDDDDDLDLHPMTFMYERDLKILKMCICIPKLNLKVKAFKSYRADRETEMQMHTTALLRHIIGGNKLV